MKHIVRYRFMTIPNKLYGEIRITTDDRSPEYGALFDGGKSTNISLYPVINIQIARPSQIDENGNKIRIPFKMSDSIGLTKFNLPIYINELKGIAEGMKTPDLYTYHGERLELNDKAAEKLRRVFVLGNTTLELVPVVISQNEMLIEGIKMKFNNEASSVLLSLNDLTSLIWNLEHVEIDYLSLQLYVTYMKSTVVHNDGSIQRNPNPKELVDIVPKEIKEEIGGIQS